MTDYPLTAGQQQNLANFLNSGKGLYIEGNDFGMYHKTHPIYQMFGCTYGGDGASKNNVETLYGQDMTLMNTAEHAYTYGSAYPDQFVDFFTSNGGDIIFESQDGRGRGVAYSGPSGAYRAVHLSFWFGAIKDAPSSHTKKETMAAIVRYLAGDTLVCAVENELPCSTGGRCLLLLENEAVQAGRWYAVLGSMSGTSPGTPAGGVTLPLNADSVFSTIRNNLNSPMFQNFKATLDASGRRRAMLNIPWPLNPNLAGRSLHLAYLLAAPIDYASNPAEVRIVP